MPDFTLFLPPEICGAILSHVNQVDCIECMIACRRWHQLIPQYANDAWTELEISKNSWSRFNSGMLECLGPHVKKVSITSDTNSNKILQRLESHGCKFESLEINGIYQIYTFDLARDTLVFSAGLSATLKELFLIGRCAHYRPLEMLLNAFPALTHLTCALQCYQVLKDRGNDDSITSEKLQNIQSSNDDDDNHNYNLVFLYLYGGAYGGHQIEKITKRCPRLKYLLVSRSVVTEDDESVDFSRILEQCPSIRYVDWNRGIPSKMETAWLTLSRRKNTDNKYESSNYEEREANHLRQVEFYNDDEQRHLLALTVCLQRPSLLEHLRLAGWFEVDLYRLWNSFAHRNSYLLSQPTPLKSLELVDFDLPRQIENNRLFKSLFHHFQHIERLKLRFFTAAILNVKEEDNRVPKMFEAIGDYLHQLRYLYLGTSTFGHWRHSMILCNNLVTIICNSCQKLESLRLYNVYISREMLLDLCHHPKLHTLNLSGNQLHKHLKKKAWVSFARKLKEQEKRSYSGGKITSIVLDCEHSDDVTDKVLKEFARVKSLTTLRIELNDHITDAGIKKFASIKNSIGQEYKKIEVCFCSNVSEDNPQVVDLSYQD